MSAIAVADAAGYANAARTQYLTAGETRFAFREFGAPGGVPLVLCQRFRGTMDDWDPLFLDTVAAERRVVIFDNAGVGRSSGECPSAIAGMAEHAQAFIRAFGADQVDVLGWSMGGAVALALAIAHPDLVRRLVIAASGPGSIPGAKSMSDEVRQAATKPVNDDQDFLFLFFDGSERRRAAGRAYLARLHHRAEPPGPPTRLATVQSMALALRGWRVGGEGVYARLGEIGKPVLVATGAHDVMVPAGDSFAILEQLPNAELVVYADGGHGFLFQHAKRFGTHVSQFLASPDGGP